MEKQHKKTLLALAYSPLVDLTITTADAVTMQTTVLNKLKSGIAHFAFEKKDGSIRMAYGTLEPGLLPVVEPTPVPAAEAKEKKEDSNPHLQKYYDLEAKAWRAYNINKLVALF